MILNDRQSTAGVIKAQVPRKSKQAQNFFGDFFGHQNETKYQEKTTN